MNVKKYINIIESVVWWNGESQRGHYFLVFTTRLRQSSIAHGGNDDAN